MPGYGLPQVKKENAPKRKRSRSRSGGLEKDDLNYVDEDSELSSGEEGLQSDFDSNHLNDNKFTNHQGGPYHVKKRGRPRVHPQTTTPREKSISMTSSPYNTPPQQQPVSNGYESDFDETGEQKVDKFGKLWGGREYKVPTFKLPTRDDTLFMFSKDPAALLGFRDSFVFLKKNIKLQKVHIDNTEKGFLVDSNLLRSTFRTREISVVTARSVFKQFGHRIIRKGRKGRDDYYFTEEIDDEEEVSEDEPSIAMKDDNKPAFSTQFINTTGKNNLSHKLTLQDTMINDLNFLHHAAVSARQFNTSLFAYRRNNPTNYDLLTNVYQIPESKQTLLDTGSIITTEEVVPTTGDIMPL